MEGAVPRHTNDKRSQRRSTATSERERPARRRPPRDVDAQAVALRESGASFSAIARVLDLARATDAHRSFVHGLAACDGAQRRNLVKNEEDRLDRLELRIRDRDAGDTIKIERRLLGVARLREAIQP
jgi:hypothetical protein